MSDIDDALDATPTAPKKRGRPPATAAKKAATKPGKATVTRLPKPGPTPKGAKGNGATAPVGKTPKVAAKTAAAPKPKKVAEDVEMTQPDDSVVLKAVRKIKAGSNEMASKFAAGLGVHRRVIRAQLQRLAKDKANGVGMKKEGPNWFVSNTQK